MKEVFQRHWFRLPSKIRKPFVLLVGLAFVISAGLIGWIPGPGGIPLFLIGVAILATEFSWAERLKRFTLHNIHRASAWLRTRPVLRRLTIGAIIATAALGLFGLFRLLLE
jgi:uncharacterized protein (TIGR02611 family)